MTADGCTLEEVMRRWKLERPLYEELTKQISLTIQGGLRKQGLLARVTSRTKDDLSLAKKIIRKGVSLAAYDSISDKSAARVVCRFRENIDRIAEIIEEKFVVIKKEDKSDLLDVREMGYRSLHFDVRLASGLLSEGEAAALTRMANLVGEVQVRTICEDAWAEVQHEIGYKPLHELASDEIARLVFCLGGLFEVADNSFSAIRTKMMSSIQVEPMTLLPYIENHFLRLAEQDYDRELSLSVLDILSPLLGEDLTELVRGLDLYVDEISLRYKTILKDHQSELAVCPYYAQPEILVILYLVERDPYRLIQCWEGSFPMSDLRRIATWWGHSLDDLIDRFE